MKNKNWLAITEESVIFMSIFKWVGLAAVIGFFVGCMTAFFLKVLHLGEASLSEFPLYYFLLPLGLAISAGLIHYLSPDSEGHGTERVIQSVHKKMGKIRFRVVPVKLVATIVTILSGGSVGKEGPCAQIGAAIASSFSNLLRFSAQDRKKLVICGISAGFAAVFGTPVAGAIFGVEVLFVGGILYEVLLPSFVAGMISYQVTTSLGINYQYNIIEQLPSFSPFFLFEVVLAGVFFGLVSTFFIVVTKKINTLSGKLDIWPPLKGLIGGVILIAIAVVFSPKYLNLGLETIEGVLQGDSVEWYAFIIKSFTTAITLSFGGSGGILTPIFFVGTTAGVCFALLFNLSTITFAAFGLVSMLAGAANTPIAATILAVELFGAEIAPYATIACVVSFLMTGYRSVFPSQVLAINKSQAFSVKTGSEVDCSQPRFDYKTRRVMATGRLVAKRLGKRGFTFRD